MVASLVETLDATGALENTYIVFTSDNGYHLGEHRLPLGKQSLHDESLRVPRSCEARECHPAQTRMPSPSTSTLRHLCRVGRCLARGLCRRPLACSAPGGETPDHWRQGFLVEHYNRTVPRDWGALGLVTMEEGLDNADNQDELEEGDELVGIAPVDAPPYLALRTVKYLYVQYANGERELLQHADRPVSAPEPRRHRRPGTAR